MSRANSSGNGSGVPAVFYVRMSSDKQDASPEQQRAELIKLAARDCFHVVGEYRDDAISGDRTDKRDAFQQMIRDAAAGKFKAILCWDQDRFGRFDSLYCGRFVWGEQKSGRTATTPHPDGGTYVFTSLLWCGKCGSRMLGSRRWGHERYRCDGHERRHKCDTNGTDQAELLDAVVGAIEQRFTDPGTIQRLRDFLAQKLSQRTQTVDGKNLRKRLAKVDNQLTSARRNMALANGDDLRV
jgi:hypothetical protein